MHTPMTNAETPPEQATGTNKRAFLLIKQDKAEIRASIPENYTVEQAKYVLAEKAGYEPTIATEDDDGGMSVRLAVKTEDGRLRLLRDETTFRELEEGSRLMPIPSLAPARC